MTRVRLTLESKYQSSKVLTGRVISQHNSVQVVSARVVVLIAFVCVTDVTLESSTGNSLCLWIAFNGNSNIYSSNDNNTIQVSTVNCFWGIFHYKRTTRHI